MPAAADDALYREAFESHILPRIHRFEPEAVLISAGFDAHAEDPLAQVCLSTEFYGWMSQAMMEIADRHANGRLLSLLEGGYNVDVLPLCVATHLRVLAGIGREIDEGGSPPSR